MSNSSILRGEALKKRDFHASSKTFMTLKLSSPWRLSFHEANRSRGEEWGGMKRAKTVRLAWDKNEHRGLPQFGIKCKRL